LFKLKIEFIFRSNIDDTSDEEIDDLNSPDDIQLVDYQKNISGNNSVSNYCFPELFKNTEQ